MDDRDRGAIEELFGKLRSVESQSMPRDPEAERYIRTQIAAQPGAPYYMAQTIVMQEQALQAAQERIEALERGSAGRPQGGGLLSGIFGGSDRGADSQGGNQYGRSAGYDRRVDPRAGDPRTGGPWGGGAYGRGGGGGGFLAGAAQTAMGVAGGVLLGNMIGDMFDIGEPEAADVADAGGGADMAQEDTADLGADDGGGDFGGGDFDFG